VGSLRGGKKEGEDALDVRKWCHPFALLLGKGPKGSKFRRAREEEKRVPGSHEGILIKFGRGEKGKPGERGRILSLRKTFLRTRGEKRGGKNGRRRRELPFHAAWDTKRRGVFDSRKGGERKLSTPTDPLVGGGRRSERRQRAILQIWVMGTLLARERSGREKEGGSPSKLHFLDDCLNLGGRGAAPSRNGEGEKKRGEEKNSSRNLVKKWSRAAFLAKKSKKGKK